MADHRSTQQSSTNVLFGQGSQYAVYGWPPESEAAIPTDSSSRCNAMENMPDLQELV